ncbi:MAG TPA: hypothetical protein VD905_05780 [Flavobacteriales bacterium]|nr:hypothetical protein [Flavobacteriales bacterium]
MRIHKSLFCLVFLGMAAGVFAQSSFSDLGDDFEERDFKLFLRRTTVFPDKDGSYGGISINGQLAINKYEKGRACIRYENPTLGDFVFILARLINGKSTQTASGLEHAYGAGFMGWFQGHKNVVATSRFILSPGISFGDYIFGVERKISSSVVALDPIGYFIAAGPSLMTNYYVGYGFWVDAYVNYDLAFGKVKFERGNYTPIENYPKPHFLQYGFDIHHKSGFFIGPRINSVVDRGSNNVTAMRLDISAGYCFKGKKN